MDGPSLLPAAEVTPKAGKPIRHPQEDRVAATRLPSGRVAIVVVTHKYCYPLERCLESFRDLLTNPADLIFVDNGSQGELSKWVGEQFSDISVVELSENGHFCGGYNAGIQHALDRNYEFVLIVNADTEVCDPEFVSRLIAAAETHPKAAFLGPQVYIRESGRIQNTILQYPSFLRNVWSWFACRLFSTCPSATERELHVDFLNGVCLLCRSEAVREIGLMDENLAAYVEDTDWHWRARKLGWSSMFIPTPSIIHHQTERGYEHYSLNSFLLRRNTVYWHMKHGRRLEGHMYALSSTCLARLRFAWAWLTGGRAKQHRYYVTRSELAYRNLLRDEPLGDWFGPLHGPWSPPE